ncbi:MAG TPA: glycine cleavage system protein H, partial [Methylomirabilota bacterium]|nr:glycine cleavage system protein H [Methylomirabilota bacterium]
MVIPPDLRYTKEHEWVLVSDGIGTVGITDYAQDQLGDIVYVDLPDIGSTIELGAVVGELESTKSVSDVYSPVSGEV